MGIRIYCPVPDEPPPKATWLELTCDADHGLLPPPSATFRDEGYVAQRAAATRLGWSEVHPPVAGRAFLCPACAAAWPAVALRAG